jgi:hypothetical protein
VQYVGGKKQKQKLHHRCNRSVEKTGKGKNCTVGAKLNRHVHCIKRPDLQHIGKKNNRKKITLEVPTFPLSSPKTTLPSIFPCSLSIALFNI